MKMKTSNYRNLQKAPLRHSRVPFSSNGSRCNSRTAFPFHSSIGRAFDVATGEPNIIVTEELTPQLDVTPFNWAGNWYPVALAIDVDGTRPTPIALLNEKLVVWKDNGGAWRCLEDSCPHRRAPLSEGKVWSDGSLMCSYHGWRFRGEDGRCIAIPQADSAELEARACSNTKSCASSRPVKEAQGKLWIWGGDKVIDPESVPLALDPLWASAATSGDPNLIVMAEFSREMMYDYSTLVENVVDPSHVPFSHHKVQGNRDKIMHGMYDMKRDEAARLSSNPNEIAARFVTSLQQRGLGSLSFTPPVLVQFASRLTESPSEWFSFSIYCVPTSPGRSKLTIHQATNYRKLPFIFKIFSRIPRWLDHMLQRNKVLDGDSVFLHVQEHGLAEEARARGDEDSSAWKQAFYCPFQTDVMVVAFRQWLDNVGGGGPYGPLHKALGHKESRIFSKEELLDRFESHTKICSDCRKGFDMFSKLRWVTGAAAAVSWGAALSSAIMQGFRSQQALFFCVLGVLTTGAYNVCCGLRQNFIFADYVHADR